MFKKIAAIFLCAALFSFVPVMADGPLLINGDFEDAEITFTNTETIPTPDGTFFARLKSETVANSDGKYVHTSEYIHKITLEAGKMYEISMEVAEDGGTGTGNLSAEYFGGNETLVLSIENAGNRMNRISTAFVAGESGEISLEISAVTLSGLGLLIDNIEIIQSEKVPEKIEITGARSAFLPPYESETYSYRAALVDKNGSIIPITSGGVSFTNLPEGVYADDESGTVTVTNRAKEGDTFTVTTRQSSMTSALPQKEIEVKLVKNYIENGNFEDFPPNRGFETESGSMEIISNLSGNVAKISSVEKDFVYGASILVEKTYVLQPGKMYVLRAEAFSEAGYTSRYTTVSAGQLSFDGFVDVNIENLGEEKTEIVSVIRVLSEGIYKIRLNFTNPDGRNVFIRNIGLFEEESKPSEILIKAPAHISLSDREIKVPVLYAARDQEGSVIPNMPGISLRLENGSESVYLEDGFLVVLPGAKSGKYTILAESDTVSKKAYVELSGASVGDGGFEKYAPGEWFSTAEPSTLHFVDYKNYGFEGGGEKAARLTMGGAVSAVLSDSVYNFKGGEVYVFGGNFMTAAESRAVLSLLLCDVNDVNYINTVAVMQSEISGGRIKTVFTPPRDMAARLMLGFTDEGGGQTILFDDIYLEKAAVYCDGVSIGGEGSVGKILKGKYNLHANFDGVDISKFRWLTSKEENGVYIPIEGIGDNNLTVLEDMANSYIKFEVTPITLNGPVFGESVTSEPIFIKRDNEPDEYYDDEYYEDEGGEVLEEPKEERGLSVVDIYSADMKGFKPFVDIESHWAKEDINIMSAAAIVNGKKNQLFMPDEQVTRAEFAAFIARAFSLSALEYSGTFKDVKAHNWYSGAVEIISKYGIANGVGDDMFLPDEPITREQIAVMVMRSMKLSGLLPEGEREIIFADSSSISPFAKSFVSEGVKTGIIKGFDDGEFKPQKTATRAEAVVLIKRMITYILNAGQ